MPAVNFTLDLVGVKSGHLKVIRVENHKSRNMCFCVCDCGRNTWARVSRIISGRSQSCGCRRYDKVTSHGMSGKRNRHPLYGIWTSMVARCSNVKHKQYDSYGGRGITVCDRWLGNEGFANFLSYMGDRPDGCSLDRVDNDKGYSPDNCRWATVKVQQRNTRGNRMATCDGKTQCVAAWAEEVGVPWYLIRNRLEQGWSDERAIKTPYKPKARNCK